METIENKQIGKQLKTNRDQQNPQRFTWISFQLKTNTLIVFQLKTIGNNSPLIRPPWQSVVVVLQTYVFPPYMTFSLCFMCSPCQSVVVAVVVALCKVLSVLFSTEFTWKKLSTEVYLDKVWKQLKTNRLENN